MSIGRGGSSGCHQPSGKSKCNHGCLKHHDWGIHNEKQTCFFSVITLSLIQLRRPTLVRFWVQILGFLWGGSRLCKCLFLYQGSCFQHNCCNLVLEVGNKLLNLKCWSMWITLGRGRCGIGFHIAGCRGARGMVGCDNRFYLVNS